MHKNHKEITNINKTCKFNYNEYAIVECVQSIQLIQDTKKNNIKLNEQEDGSYTEKTRRCRCGSALTLGLYASILSLEEAQNKT